MTYILVLPQVFIIFFSVTEESQYTVFSRMMTRGNLSNSTDLLFSLCISIQNIYGFPIDVCSFVIPIFCSWKRAQLHFVLWEWLQAVSIISGLTKIIEKNSSNILCCAAIHAQQTDESNGTVAFKPCLLVLNIIKEIKTKQMQIIQESEYFYKFWKCFVIKLIFIMLEAILNGFISIAPWQYCWVMNAMIG